MSATVDTSNRITQDSLLIVIIGSFPSIAWSDYSPDAVFAPSGVPVATVYSSDPILLCFLAISIPSPLLGPVDPRIFAVEHTAVGKRCVDHMDEETVFVPRWVADNVDWIARLESLG